MLAKTAVVSVLSFCAISAYASDSSDLRSILNEPLKNDGHVFYMTIYPYDAGSKTSYYICWDACSAEPAMESAAAITPLTPGEFDGMHGDHAVRVRVRFNAYCFRPNGLCTKLAYFFDEVGPEATQHSERPH